MGELAKSGILVMIGLFAALAVAACGENDGVETANEIRERLNRINERSSLDGPAPVPAATSERPDSVTSDGSDALASDPAVTSPPPAPPSNVPTPPIADDDELDPVPFCRKADPPCLNQDGLLIEP